MWKRSEPDIRDRACTRNLLAVICGMQWIQLSYNHLSFHLPIKHLHTTYWTTHFGHFLDEFPSAKSILERMVADALHLHQPALTLSMLIPDLSKRTSSRPLDQFIWLVPMAKKSTWSRQVLKQPGSASASFHPSLEWLHVWLSRKKHQITSWHASMFHGNSSRLEILFRIKPRCVYVCIWDKDSQWEWLILGIGSRNSCYPSCVLGWQSHFQK